MSVLNFHLVYFGEGVTITSVLHEICCWMWALPDANPSLLFSRFLGLCRHQLEAFYSIFTTEQQDHVKSVEYLRSNFRPIQSLDNRHVFKSAVKDAWLPDLTDSGSGPSGTEASKGRVADGHCKATLTLHLDQIL